ncbi:MAG: hypothetical protein ACOX69_00645 [Coriobacteriales bacterium]|jgi:Fe-S-cluster-containing dehydrogenase component
MSNALVINYQFCTGCHSCEIACKTEHGYPTGQWGIKILQDGPREKEDGTWEYNYLPMPTSLCDLCADRVAEGRWPKCVHHCQAGCMYYGTVEEMAKVAEEHPNSALFRLKD